MSIKLKEMPNTVVNTKTKEEFNKLMKIYRETGWKGNDGTFPTLDMYSALTWLDYQKDTCVKIEDGFKYSSREFYQEEGCNIISFGEFLEKQGLVKCKGEYYPSIWGFPIIDGKLPIIQTSQDGSYTIIQTSQVGSCSGLIDKGRDAWIACNSKGHKSTKQNKMNKLTKTLKRVLNKNMRALYKANYINGDLELTTEGISALFTILLEEYEKELAQEAKEELKELKEN